jgi:cell division protein ZapA
MNKVKVSIAGKDYQISTEEPAEIFRRRAERVNRTIEEFESGRLGVQNAAVLAALDAFTEADKSEESVDNLRLQIKEYVDEAVKARSEADEALKKYDKLKKKHDEALIKAAEAEKKCAEAEKKCIELEKQQTQIAELKNNLEHIHKAEDSKPDKETKRALEQSRKEITTLKRENEQFQTKLKDKTTEVDRLKKIIADLEFKNTELEKDNADLWKELK